MWPAGNHSIDRAYAASLGGNEYLVMMSAILERWNVAAFGLLNAGAQAPASIILLARACAQWGIFLALVLLMWAWVRRGAAVRYALLDAVVAAVIGLCLAQVIAANWVHPRPCELGLGRQLLAHVPEASFPSDHATLMFSLALPMLFAQAGRRLGAILLGMALVISWSRIYLGVHFPMDMIGAFGVACGATVIVRALMGLLHRGVYPGVITLYEKAIAVMRLPRRLFPRAM
jgi:undecaprenyl-diphosphatase